MNRAIRKVHLLRAESQVRNSFTVIAMVLLIMVFSEFARITMCFRQIETHLQSAVVAQVVENYQEIFSGVKKKSAAAYKYDESTERFIEDIDEVDILKDVADDIGLIYDGTKAYNKNYTISNVRLEPINVPKEVNSTGVFITQVTCDVTYHYALILRNNDGFKSTVTTKAKYVKKY